MHRQTSQPTKQLMTRLGLTGNTHIIYEHFLFCYTKIKSGRREYYSKAHRVPYWICHVGFMPKANQIGSVNGLDGFDPFRY
jgi:hypothetical protein